MEAAAEGDTVVSGAFVDAMVGLDELEAEGGV